MKADTLIIAQLPLIFTLRHKKKPTKHAFSGADALRPLQTHLSARQPPASTGRTELCRPFPSQSPGTPAASPLPPCRKPRGAAHPRNHPRRRVPPVPCCTHVSGTPCRAGSGGGSYGSAAPAPGPARLGTAQHSAHLLRGASGAATRAWRLPRRGAGR